MPLHEAFCNTFFQVTQTSAASLNS